MIPSDYRKANKGSFRFMDFLIVMAVIANLGAFFLTNVMVVKVIADSNGTPEFLESNPVTASLHGFKTSLRVIVDFFKALFPLIFRALLLALYVNQRNKTYTDNGRDTLTAYVLAITYILCWDFYSNLGYWVGVKLFLGD